MFPGTVEPYCQSRIAKRCNVDVREYVEEVCSWGMSKKRIWR